jgi:hypothetical protein
MHEAGSFALHARKTEPAIFEGQFLEPFPNRLAAGGQGVEKRRQSFHATESFLVRSTSDMAEPAGPPQEETGYRRYQPKDANHHPQNKHGLRQGSYRRPAARLREDAADNI